jgi:hypothetical protein
VALAAASGAGRPRPRSARRRCAKGVCFATPPSARQQGESYWRSSVSLKRLTPRGSESGRCETRAICSAARTRGSDRACGRVPTATAHGGGAGPRAWSSVARTCGCKPRGFRNTSQALARGCALMVIYAMYFRAYPGGPPRAVFQIDATCAETPRPASQGPSAGAGSGTQRGRPGHPPSLPGPQTAANANRAALVARALADGDARVLGEVRVLAGLQAHREHRSTPRPYQALMPAGVAQAEGGRGHEPSVRGPRSKGRAKSLRSPTNMDRRWRPS